MRSMLRSYGAAKRLVQLLAALTLPIAAPAMAAPAPKLVLAFGDSLTAGYRLKPGESFPAQLEARLRRDGYKVSVRNAGVSGETTAQGRKRLGWVLQSLKAKPDLVILELGANDMLRGIDPDQTTANLSAMLVELKKRQIPVLLAGMLAAPNLGKDYRRRFDAVYPAVAKRHGVSLYPFFLAGVVGKPTLHLGDGIHPTGAGVAVVVRGIAPQVKQLLRLP